MNDEPRDMPKNDSGVPVSAFATVWVTLFLDLVGFGIIIPVLPFYAEHFGASPVLVTLLSASFSGAQFAMSPVLGRISDRVGRRPVMLISIAGACGSMLILGFAATLWMIFAARILNGMCNANISTAHAYVADRVEPKQRAKYMGMMGSAIGLGFVVGPAIGGLLSTPENPHLPFFAAAGLGAINWGMAFFLLPESRKPEAVPNRERGAIWRALRGLPGTTLGWLVVINLLFYLAFSAMESTFALLMEARLEWTARETGYLFTGIGVVIFITQGLLVGAFVKFAGEKWTLVIGMIVLGAGLYVTGTAATVVGVSLGSAGIACGNGFVSPSISALVSRGAAATVQGLSLGIMSSAAALARIFGPTGAGPLFEWLGPGVPMVVGAGLVALASIVAVLTLRSPR